MQLLVAVLLLTFALGPTRIGRWVRQTPAALLATVTLIAASYYSLGVIL